MAVVEKVAAALGSADAAGLRQSRRPTTRLMSDEPQKRPWPEDPWGGLMLLAVFVVTAAPAFFVSRLMFEEPGPVLVGFFAGLVAVVLWVRRYEGEWTWGD
jgi:hypothetical protein